MLEPSLYMQAEAYSTQRLVSSYFLVSVLDKSYRKLPFTNVV